MLHFSALQEAFDIFELLPVLLLGVIGGLLGSCFTYLNEALADWRKRGMQCCPKPCCAGLGGCRHWAASTGTSWLDCLCMGMVLLDQHQLWHAASGWGTFVHYVWCAGLHGMTCASTLTGQHLVCTCVCCCAVLLPHGTRGRLWEALAAALLTSTVSFMLPMMVACQVSIHALTVTSVQASPFASVASVHCFYKCA